MMIVTDMDTGKKRVDPTEEYSEEVLLANWTPRLQVELGLQEATPVEVEKSDATRDIEAFMRAVYLSQE